ncbi:hypothetical protein BSK62_01825 [Paenibacillus odorifer]|uniref:DUF6033 family protein n=1 Tax=Paenibacillus TaxID=44249 RepID=UPI00096F6340|nr:MULTISPECIES: DUF6033 family protein [Paenibacillus]MDH6426227.1 hypothetical protein [Paenibacillus sp. PastH-4]MDH6442249.1 hypothetical protein [Paenibacillus sp. PastF-4]MDH6527037.1 hypothetical protein [Paenibacillus sp. PastH-3]OMD69635.1 hypothetical protein BSK62_01825 [Paenibacillus odorifer]
MLNVASLSNLNRVETTKVSPKNQTSEVSFQDVLSTTHAEAVLTNLEEKFDIKINVQAIPKSKEAVKSIYSNCAGKGNVTIAPNILNQSATDPQLQNKVEAIIQDHFTSSANDKPGDVSGVVIHPDGTATFWVIGDYLTPAEREKIQKEVEADKKKRAEQLDSLNKVSSNDPISQFGLPAEISSGSEEDNSMNLNSIRQASLDSMLRKKNLLIK